MNCNLCNSNRIKDLYKTDTIIIKKCSKCSLVFTDPTTLDSNLKKTYDSTYFNVAHKNYFSSCSPEYEKKDDQKLKRFMRVLEEDITKTSPSRSILDVGCATGVFLDMAKKKGLKPLGVDISEYAVKYAKDNFGIEVINGELEKINFKYQKFDIITMWDFLEHCANPNGAIKKANEILKKDGILFVLTINEDSLMNKLADILYKISFGKFTTPIKKLHPIHHRFHFSEKTLKEMLRRNGFKVIKKRSSEVPLSNIEEKSLIKFGLRMIYLLANLFNMQYEREMICTKIN